MKLPNKLFMVSCQATEHEPMYGKGVVPCLVKAALAGGAKGIRISQEENLKPVLELVPKDLPLICLIKKHYENSDVVITPTLKELEFLTLNNAPIIAIDATLRQRPKESLAELVAWFKKNKKEHQLLMADCSDYEDVANAFELGFDLIGTTLRGYTKETSGISNLDNEMQFLKDVVKLNKKYNKYIVAEGGFNSPNDVKKAFAIGANCVTVGSMITRPNIITKWFLDNIK
ncbi:N-acylglucosamine-6-phosphate 2-epimerase [Mycoplasmopsis californica]|uniref:Putative N-acetylmannosamine-6-phosphate 2-epimerase n=1 Tax=Mycoplasmopsis equigenitalium TaxID=114883 RepID=A0ABY5J0P1_9BACT|nr:N-acetylmannosamine-6-phosphate 2-epimerase [Mycoplasmopsis equigenitalium]UUD36826.1 N-acetylmannosamine-6-phosphate 2-epimerase [Mycoplasmopsis equigenitalium]VEU69877.1 N-acylglucosamine-6-phosphate 2-epimerase [Mycoplasmopsis californica]